MKKIILTALFLPLLYLPKANAWSNYDPMLAYMVMQSINPVFNYALYNNPPYYYPVIPVVNTAPDISVQNNRIAPIYLQEKINQRPSRDNDDPRLSHGLPIE